MNKQELMDLMQFVIDSNSRVLTETTAGLDINPQQQRNMLNAVESKTKDCFFRMIDRADTSTKKTKRSKK